MNALQKSVAYISGKKFALLLVLLLIILLPNAISKPSQTQTTLIVPTLGIAINGDEISVSCEIVVPNPGKQEPQYDVITKTGSRTDGIIKILHDIEKDEGKEISLHHCTAVAFGAEPDADILTDLVTHTDIRSNSAAVENTDTLNLDGEKIDQIILYNNSHGIHTPTIDDIRMKRP
jgi:hypothetical protein